MQVLIKLNVAWLQWSYENRYFQIDKPIAQCLYIRLTILKSYLGSAQNFRSNWNLSRYINSERKGTMFLIFLLKKGVLCLCLWWWTKVHNVDEFRGVKGAQFFLLGDVYEFDLSIPIDLDILWTASGDEHVCSSFSDYETSKVKYHLDLCINYKHCKKPPCLVESTTYTTYLGDAINLIGHFIHRQAGIKQHNFLFHLRDTSFT